MAPRRPPLTAALPRWPGSAHARAAAARFLAGHALLAGDLLAVHSEPHASHAATTSRALDGSAARVRLPPRGPSHGWAFVRDGDSAEEIARPSRSQPEGAHLGESAAMAASASRAASDAGGCVRTESQPQPQPQQRGGSEPTAAVAARAAFDRARSLVADVTSQARRSLASAVPARSAHVGALLAEAELKHGRIALLGAAHLALRAAVGDGAPGSYAAAAPGANAAAALMAELAFPPLPGTAVSLMMAAESAASQAVGGAQRGAPWTAWCVLLAACSLVEGFNLSRQNYEASAAPPRELGAGSVSARLAALRAAERGAAAPLAARQSVPPAPPAAMLSARSQRETATTKAGAADAAAAGSETSVVRPSAADWERAAGRLAMLHFAGLAIAVFDLLGRA